MLITSQCQQILKELKAIPTLEFVFFLMWLSVISKTKEVQWNCTDIGGMTSNVSPQPCDLLPDKHLESGCDFPTDVLPIDKVEFKTCKLASH